MPISKGALPPTNLEKLAREVLRGQPPEAALPCNLSDQWLDLVSRDLDVCFGDGETEAGAPSKSHMAGPLALIVHLLFAKQGGDSVKVPFEELERYMSDFRIEVALELVSRQTNLSASRATVETIFENRTVEVAAQAG